MSIREPAVSGQFYPSSKLALLKNIQGLVDKSAPKKDAIACVMPHAGYVYSGSVAGAVAERIADKDTIVIIGPNHTGIGKQFSLMNEGAWRTPLGEVEIDSGLANIIRQESSLIEIDSSAHNLEHSIEVQLPFFQYLSSNFKFVPLIVFPAPKDVYKSIGAAISRAIKKSSKEKQVLIVASSDMSHYEPEAAAKKKDNEAIAAMLKLNEDLLISKVEEFDISMCGYAPAAIAIAAAKELGAKSAELMKYQTSGDVTGDKSAVVGYAGIIIT